MYSKIRVQYFDYGLVRVNIAMRINKKEVTVIECNKHMGCELMGLFDASCY